MIIVVIAATIVFDQQLATNFSDTWSCGAVSRRGCYRVRRFSVGFWQIFFVVVDEPVLVGVEGAGVVVDKQALQLVDVRDGGSQGGYLDKQNHDSFFYS